MLHMLFGAFMLLTLMIIGTILQDLWGMWNDETDTCDYDTYFGDYGYDGDSGVTGPDAD